MSAMSGLWPLDFALTVVVAGEMALHETRPGGALLFQCLATLDL